MDSTLFSLGLNYYRLSLILAEYAHIGLSLKTSLHRFLVALTKNIISGFPELSNRDFAGFLNLLKSSTGARVTVQQVGRLPLT